MTGLRRKRRGEGVVCLMEENGGIGVILVSRGYFCFLVSRRGRFFFSSSFDSKFVGVLFKIFSGCMLSITWWSKFFLVVS